MGIVVMYMYINFINSLSVFVSADNICKQFVSKLF